MDYIKDLPYANSCVDVVNKMKAENPDIYEDSAFIGAMRQTLRALGAGAETLVGECLAENPDMASIVRCAQNLRTQIRIDKGEL